MANCLIDSSLLLKYKFEKNIYFLIQTNKFLKIYLFFILFNGQYKWSHQPKTKE